MSNTEATPEVSRDDAIRKGYQTALTRLREAHVDEFNTLRQEATKELGFEWTPPKSEAQKAEEQMAALAAAHPEVAARVLEGLRPVNMAGEPSVPTASSAE